jgi:hypothetical protein
MSDPKQEQQRRDELDLDAETVKDLELVEQEADDVRGGGSVPRVGVSAGPCCPTTQAH